MLRLTAMLLVCTPEPTQPTEPVVKEAAPPTTEEGLIAYVTAEVDRQSGEHHQAGGACYGGEWMFVFQELPAGH